MPWLRAALTLLALTAVVLAALAGLTPAAPAADADAPPTAFSAARAHAALEILAQEPRPPGSPAHDATRDFLLGSLTDAGFAAQVQTRMWIAPRWTSFADGYALRAARVENVVGVLPGASPRDPAVLLVAHYDSKTTTPGASDDGYGTAALVEAARALGAGPRLSRTVIVLFTDAEEEGLLGAEAYVRGGGPHADRVGLVLNFEARGNAGHALLFETAGPDLELLRTAAAATSAVRGNSLARAVYERMPNDTDFSIFRAAGHPGLNFANIAGFSRYHAPADTLAHASRATLAHHGTLALATARAFAGAPPDAPFAPDRGRAVFFDVAGHLVVYPAAWSPWITALAFLSLAVAAWRVARRVPAARRRILLLVGTQLGALVGALVVAVGLLSLVLALVPGAGGPDVRPALVRVAAVGFVLVGLVAASLAARAFPDAAPLERHIAGGGLLVLVSLGLHQSLPGGAYLFAWPALASGLTALAADRFTHHEATRAPVLAAALVPTLFLVAPHGYHVAVAFGLLSGPGLTVLATLVLVAAPAPILAATPPRAWLLPAVAGVLALACALAPLALDRHDAEHPRPSTVLLAVDADTGIAEWLSPDPTPPSWAAARFTAAAAPRPGFFPLEPARRFHSGPAPAPAELAAPRATLVADEPTADGAGRRLRLRLDAAPDTVTLAIHATGAPLGSASLDGEAITTFYGQDLHVHLWGPADAGTELVLETTGPGAVELVLVAQRMAPPPPARPAGHAAKPSMVLAPHQELMDSDTVLVRRAARF